MPAGASALIWLLIPIAATIGATWYLSRRAKANPNADIAAGVNELNQFRQALANTNPREKKSPDGKHE